VARSRTERTTDTAQESLFWLQFAVMAGVILVLLAVIWALMTATSIDSSAPRTAIERQLRALEATVEAEPESTSAWAKLIRGQALSGDLRAAEQTVARADEALGARLGRVAIEAARIAYLEEDYEAALEEIDAALKLVAQETEAEVKRLADQGVSMKPDSTAEVDARVLKADILVALDDPAGAAAVYTEALELNGQMADILVERGLLYEQLGQTEDARADFTSALMYIPDYAPALQALDRIGE